jgi:hypothetical protein
MRAGKKWEGITILLIGAFSKYVNSLQEGEERTKDQISTIKMLRAYGARAGAWSTSRLA